MSTISKTRAGTTAAPAQMPTLGFLLRELYEALQHRVYAAVAADGHVGVREVHSPVLRHLPAEGGRVVDLARASDLTKQSIAYIVQDLEQLGYLEIRPDPSDRRAKVVVWTSPGQRLVQSLLMHSARLEQELRASLGDKHMDQFRKSLESAVQAVT